MKDACKDYFVNRQYTDCIFAATKILENTIQDLSRIKDQVGIPLTKVVFNQEKPILDIPSGTKKENLHNLDGVNLLFDY